MEVRILNQIIPLTKIGNTINKTPYPHIRHSSIVSSVDSLGITTSCLSCVNFDEPTEFCTKGKMKPPARVIAFACPDYFDTEEIPY